MSTSDQQGQGPLTRKQLREIRLTGSTPVISGEEAAAAAAAADVAPPAPPLPRAAEPVEIAPVPAPVVDSAPGDAPLTRRQAREQEKIRTASVPVIGAEETEETDAGEQPAPAAIPAQADESAHAQPEPEAVAPTSAEPAEPAEILSALPDFSTPAAVEEEDDDAEDDAVIAPVSASAASDAVGAVPIATADTSSEPSEDDDALEAVLGVSAATSDDDADDDVLADVDEADDDVEEDAAEVRPTVNSAFGEGLLTDASDAHAPFRPSFDDLLGVGDSTGSQHSAPNALIFTPSPGEGSLSGPVASTGEILVTGSYELPKGIGSQGHALGTTDGKDVDAVLIDGELPPASSPTPIAASSAVSTIKPAGEVIRPPAPEKGNRLMLVLAIVAGGLALALGVALIFAFTTNVL